MPLMVRFGAGFLSLSATGPRVATGLGQVAAVLSCASPSAGASNAAPSTAAVNVITLCSIGAPSKMVCAPGRRILAEVGMSSPEWTATSADAGRSRAVGRRLAHLSEFPERRLTPACAGRSEEHTSELQSRGLISYAV